MPYTVPLEDAQAQFSEYQFLEALTPSEQKAAFHVRDATGRDLCLKLIAPTYSMDRIDREITALQLLSHPNVVRLVEYTFSTKEGSRRHYIIEEFIHGTDLQALLPPNTEWEMNRILSFFAQLCDGLEALRSIHLVHRDLKPSNIRVRPDGRPVIIDFGLARHLALPDLTKTAEGAAIGTPAYFAPEQFTGTKHDIDHRTDLFALGLLLFHAAIGHHPFFHDGISYADLQDAVCLSQSFASDPAFRALPPSVGILLTRLLAKERVRRPQSAAQVAAILRKTGGLQ
jgi:serine/threonine-protein kinase